MTSKPAHSKTLFLILLASLILATSCRKNAEEVTELLSESDAAELTEAAVSERTGGSSMQTVDMTTVIEAYLDQCGVPGDTAFTRSSSAALYSYNYTFNMDWLLHCTDLGFPIDAAVEVAGNGSFGTQRWDGMGQGSGNFVLTGLGLQEDEYLANGAYILTANVTGDLRRTDPSFDASISLTLSDLSIRKSDGYITGGSGTVTVTASGSNGNSKTRTGTLVFNGNGTATVTIGSHVYSFPV